LRCMGGSSICMRILFCPQRFFRCFGLLEGCLTHKVIETWVYRTKGNKRDTRIIKGDQIHLKYLDQAMTMKGKVTHRATIPQKGP